MKSFILPQAPLAERLALLIETCYSLRRNFALEGEMKICLLPIAAVLLAACAAGEPTPKAGFQLLTDAEAACTYADGKSCIKAWPPVELLPEPEPVESASEYWMLTGPELVNWAQDMAPPP